jgi:alkanesulfonate monooxygenase SsuD/methylene tetrahydromethanopterin reductase-like flavin-dependent oxidoreductase (luciferase family)
VINRLVCDNLDPLTALAAVAARTNRIALQSMVITVHRRNSAV